MTSRGNRITCIFIVVICLVGCTQSTPSPVKPSSSAKSQRSADSPARIPDAKEVATAGSKKPNRLADEDQKLADVQGICPVCGKPLNSVERPIKLTIGSRVVFADSQQCWGPLMTDSKTYFDKLDALREADVVKDSADDSQPSVDADK